MAQISFTCRKLSFAGEFTLPGKRRMHVAALIEVGIVAAIPMLLAFAEPAWALPQIGPTSSISIGISLSVAPKYGLNAKQAAIGAMESGAAGFCMTTNAQPLGLPVHLIRQQAHAPAPGQMAKETAAQLDWCAVGVRTTESIDRGDRGEEAALLIVRPE